MKKIKLPISQLIEHNRQAWNNQASQNCQWSRPVSAEDIEAARRGEMYPRLTPSPIPQHWLGDLRGAKVLCLAAGGGQQAPLLAAAGAIVTVYDLSDAQLDIDRQVAERERLSLRCIQGDMSDLRNFCNECFDLIFHPISNLYVPDVELVWRECARVLRPKGRLLASFYNPALFIDDRDQNLAHEGLLRPKYRIPYADTQQLDLELLAVKKSKGEALIFGHSLTSLIGGQLAAGLQLLDLIEDWQPTPRLLLEAYLPGFIATCSQKT
ncbi:class I SAM-dependent methyltransferase [Chromobacterium violaceum]|uniref:class I SAM-dependent methyltransferase n=1 Tax=Chromobacterium violaceum TaxID=536 RepID=UPI0015F9E852|nr:class I SAM-dependent methyltransferase [Chromobacterium violaceum]MBA8737423.1 class I SAM-dependent methyltransferase [Chromobacterium violaceum]